MQASKQDKFTHTLINVCAPSPLTLQEFTAADAAECHIRRGYPDLRPIAESDVPDSGPPLSPIFRTRAPC
jgi:hypothetical protein